MGLLDIICRDASCSPPLRVAQIFSSALLAVLFLQSSIDKVVDRRANEQWLAEHFARSPLAAHVRWMLTTITLVELLAGSISALGAVALLAHGGSALAIDGIALSALALLMLFFGQRLAKDYPGAAVIASYFTLTMLALALHAPGLAR